MQIVSVSNPLCSFELVRIVSRIFLLLYYFILYTALVLLACSFYKKYILNRSRGVVLKCVFLFRFRDVCLLLLYIHFLLTYIESFLYVCTYIYI